MRMEERKQLNSVELINQVRSVWTNGRVLFKIMQMSTYPVQNGVRLVEDKISWFHCHIDRHTIMSC
jgi:hypothetical protein